MNFIIYYLLFTRNNGLELKKATVKSPVKVKISLADISVHFVFHKDPLIEVQSLQKRELADFSGSSSS